MTPTPILDRDYSDAKASATSAEIPDRVNRC